MTIVGTNLDYAIIVIYFVAILGFGSFFGRHTRSTKDFFFGGQRFSWWLIAFSMVSTTVGSYSFIKYSWVAYSHGLSSTMSYTNDWFWMPMLVLVWMPIIFYSRIGSVPEYFERRFDRRVRLVATVVMMVYLLGSVGINLLTMGVALKAMLGWDVFFAAAVVALVCGIYVTAGGQTSVIMTDLMQGFLLLIAGFWLFHLGLRHVGGLSVFWDNLPVAHRLPLNYFNDPPEFNFIGVFWQDGVANSMFVYFLNQGMIMRFLSAKSPGEASRACAFLLLVLQLVAAVAVSNAGWLGRVMVSTGLLPANFDPSEVFVRVAAMVCQPGVFGFVMAALTAALMSTADTLLNATSAVAVNDIYRPFIRPTADDRQSLRVARWVSIAAAAIGLAAVPLFASFKSIYSAHGAFTAAMTPPMAAALLLGVFWRRFDATAALATIVGGAAAIFASIGKPGLIAPFSFGVRRTGTLMQTWVFQRALYGLVVSFAIGTIVALLGRGDRKAVDGLVWGTIDHARRTFKGTEPNLERGRRLLLRVRQLEQEPAVAADPPLRGVRVAASDRRALRAEVGDLLFLAHPNRIYGGLRSLQVRLAAGDAAEGELALTREALEEGQLLGVDRVRVEKLL